jgi:hypothetical protein
MQSAVPVTDQRGVSSQALAICAARIAGSRFAMMRRDIGAAAASGRYQRATPEQSAHESSP